MTLLAKSDVIIVKDLVVESGKVYGVRGSTTTSHVSLSESCFLSTAKQARRVQGKVCTT
jgi:hypothetical protein